MAKSNSVNLDITPNADGYSIAGGTTPRTLTLTAGNVTLSAGGSNTYTMPAATGTLVSRDSTDTLTNKDMSSFTNIFPTTGATTNSVTTAQTTTSTSFTDLATSGPAVTITTGTKALVVVSGRLSNGSAGQWAFMGFAVSGATTTAAADASSLAFGQSATTVDSFSQSSQIYLVTLTAGSNTFTAKYRVTGGTGTFTNRNIIVIPI